MKKDKSIHPLATFFTVLAAMLVISAFMAYEIPDKAIGRKLNVYSVGGGGGSDCTDTDGGVNVGVFGEANGEPDRCILSNSLNDDEHFVQTCGGTGCFIHEQFCDRGSATYKKLYCSQGCNDGVCGEGNAPATNQGVLNMLNNCYVNSKLTSKSAQSYTGNQFCGIDACIETYFSEVPNPNDVNYVLENTLRVVCSDSYNGNSKYYYMQSVCCSA